MINKLVFLLFIQFILVCGQLALGNIGWPLPLALLGALYIAMALGKVWGIAAALLCAMDLAILYGDSWNLLNIIFFPLLAGAVGWWVDNHDEDICIGFWAPGAWAGFVSALPALAKQLFIWNEKGCYSPEIHYILLRMLWNSAVSGALFVGFILLGEAAAEYLGLPRFLTRKGGIER